MKRREARERRTDDENHVPQKPQHREKSAFYMLKIQKYHAPFRVLQIFVKKTAISGLIKLIKKHPVVVAFVHF